MENRKYMDLPRSLIIGNLEKLKSRINYWQTRFSMIKERTTSVGYKIIIYEEIANETKNLEKKNPNLRTNEDFFNYGVEYALKLLGIELDIHFEMEEDINPTLKEYSRFYYYIQGLGKVYSYVCDGPPKDKPVKELAHKDIQKKTYVEVEQSISENNNPTKENRDLQKKLETTRIQPERKNTEEETSKILEETTILKTSMEKEFKKIQEDYRKLEKNNKELVRQNKKLSAKIEKFDELSKELTQKCDEYQQLKNEFTQIEKYFKSEVEKVIQEAEQNIEKTNGTRNPLIQTYWLELIKFLKKRQAEEINSKKSIFLFIWSKNLRILTENLNNMFSDLDCLFCMRVLREYTGELPTQEDYDNLWQQACSMTWEEATPHIDFVLSFKGSLDYRQLGFPHQLATALETVAIPLPEREDEKKVLRKFLTVCALAFKNMWERYKEGIALVRKA